MAASASVTIKLLADVKAAQSALAGVSRELKGLQSTARGATGGGRGGILGLFGGNHNAQGVSVGRALGQGLRGGMRSALAIGGSAGGFATMLGGGGLMAIAGGVGAYMIKQAYDFTNAWTNVQKVVNGTPQQMDALKSQAFTLAHDMASTPNTVAGVMAVGGQMNVPTDQLADFTRVMLGAGLATDMTAENAANMSGQFANAMGEMDPKKWEKIISTVDALADIIPGGETKVLDLAQRFALAGKSVGLSSAQVLGYSSFATGLGIDPEMGGSALAHMFISLAETGAAARGQSAADPHAVRDATDRAGDLGGDLALAEERRKEMFSSRTGRLLKQYRKHPAELMAADMQIARLKREQEQAREAVDEASHPGQEKARAWAAMAGMSLEDYGAGVKDDPAGTFRKVLGGLSGEEATGNLYPALGKMGIADIRELMTLAPMVQNLGGKDGMPGLDQTLAQAITEWNDPKKLSKDIGQQQGTDAFKLLQSGIDVEILAVQNGMGLLKVSAQTASDAMANYTSVANGTKSGLDGLVDTFNKLDPMLKTFAALSLAPAAGSALSLMAQLAGIGAAAGGGSSVAGSVAAAAGGGALGTAATGVGVGVAAATPLLLATSWPDTLRKMNAESQGLIAGLTPMQQLAVANRLKQQGLSGQEIGPGAVRQAINELHITSPTISVTVVQNADGTLDYTKVAQNIWDGLIAAAKEATSTSNRAPVTPALGGARY